MKIHDFFFKIWSIDSRKMQNWISFTLMLDWFQPMDIKWYRCVFKSYQKVLYYFVYRVSETGILIILSGLWLSKFYKLSLMSCRFQKILQGGAFLWLGSSWQPRTFFDALLCKVLIFVVFLSKLWHSVSQNVFVWGDSFIRQI